jgi:hypothetical protein
VLTLVQLVHLSGLLHRTATCCIHTRNAYQEGESWVPSCTFGGNQAQTASGRWVSVVPYSGLLWAGFLNIRINFLKCRLDNTIYVLAALLFELFLGKRSAAASAGCANHVVRDIRL